jgi:hypothetical protein
MASSSLSLRRSVLGVGRSGSKYLRRFLILHHEKLEHQSAAQQTTMDEVVDYSDKKVAVIEIGAGFNTPTQGSEDLRVVSTAEGW